MAERMTGFGGIQARLGERGTAQAGVRNGIAFILNQVRSNLPVSIANAVSAFDDDQLA